MPEEVSQPKGEGAAPATAYATLLDKIVLEGKMAKDESQRSSAKALVSEFAGQIEEGMTVGENTIASIQDRIAQIDQLLSNQLNEVLHHPEFQKVEASWRGLYYLVTHSETGPHLKIRLLNATKQDLVKDLERAMEFDQSVLFKRIYEDEYGTYGGNPYSCLIGDYEWGRSPQDLGTLEKLSNVAAASHAPLISAASPKLFDWESFTELHAPRDLAKGFESTELTKWRGLRESEDSRYVSLVLPHVLLRTPYGPDTVPVEGFNFVENVNGKDHSKYLWGNAAYVMGERISTAFTKYRWCAAIRGVEGGGIVEGLPTHTFKTDEGDVALKCPTEIAITDRREKELSDLGFIALCHCKNTDVAAFFGGQTANKPKLYNTNEANANSRISAQLPYILAASRFAHYIKVLMRDKIGSFMTKENVASFLNNWIADYVLLNDNAPQDAKATNPLREARVDVYDVPGKPGLYQAVVFLRPHFQLEGLSASIRLVAQLPPPAAG